MSAYRQMIVEDTGCKPADAAMIEYIMREDVFHSTGTDFSSLIFVWLYLMSFIGFPFRVRPPVPDAVPGQNAARHCEYAPASN